MKRTDLALEAREVIKGEGELAGVVLEKEKREGNGIQISTLRIVDDNGSNAMGKEKGTYVTIEMEPKCGEDASEELRYQLNKMLGDVTDKKILVLGLGNREITPDALGPWVVDLLQVTHPIIEIYGKEWKKKKGWKDTFALAPGVLAQTGMEAGEIVKALCKEMQLDLILVVDALAARSVSRLNCTIQLTNTGISPGSGVGNNRKEITKRTMGVDVIAIGVPTVVDAETIVEEYVEEGFYKMGLGEKDMEICLREMRGGKMKGLFMASKSIDEDVQRMSKIIGDALNRFILDLPEKRKHI